MKKLYILVSAFTMIILFNSCNSDDNNNLNITEKVITATIEPASTNTAEDDELPFTVNLPEQLPSDLKLRILVTLNDGRTKVQNVEIPQGETAVTGYIYMPAADDFSFGFNGMPEFGKIQVEGGVLTEPEKGTHYTITSDAVNLNFYDKVAPLNKEGITALFDWDSAIAADLDLYIYDSNSNLIQGAESGDRYELVELLNSEPDGDYTITTGVYSTSISDIPYKLFIKESSGKQFLIEGTLNNVADGDVINLVTFNKTGDIITIL